MAPLVPAEHSCLPVPRPRRPGCPGRRELTAPPGEAVGPKVEGSFVLQQEAGGTSIHHEGVGGKRSDSRCPWAAGSLPQRPPHKLRLKDSRTAAPRVGQGVLGGRSPSVSRWALRCVDGPHRHVSPAHRSFPRKELETSLEPQVERPGGRVCHFGVRHEGRWLGDGRTDGRTEGSCQSKHCRDVLTRLVCALAQGPSNSAVCWEILMISVGGRKTQTLSAELTAWTGSLCADLTSFPPAALRASRRSRASLGAVEPGECTGAGAEEPLAAFEDEVPCARSRDIAGVSLAAVPSAAPVVCLARF